MKANFRKIKTSPEQAFLIRKDERIHFYDDWHFHEMLELVVILKGKGQRSIGDSIESFSKGDVILLGSKLPHVWRSNPPKNLNDVKSKCVSIIIQFPPNFIGSSFLNLSESKKLNELFKNAEMGISFINNTSKILIKKVKKLILLKGMARIVLFLEILHIASISKEYRLLASPLFKETIFKSDLKINKVFEFVMDNFSNPITLDEVAKVGLMNKTAFCRYFKNRTNKTFTGFLNEIRIGYACKLIQEEKYSLKEAAYLSGYNSPSHFNKQFHRIKNMSPSDFLNNIKEIQS
ncbi:AraC family transcriptional regulator [Sabulilitoribacter arenilitoris]|uniref:AraC family transcriptional regulator n=1 Tax=Wocania arenilitoris TaxID=2044858 RepID=A0AAE3EL54_9FLAO|nr:AraC family transcriptional regulator [Wocania arenilitoris]MCF7567496.1 AraC family transcriptional regulator [Wocania arenilitoris]